MSSPAQVEPELDPGQNPPWAVCLVHRAQDLTNVDVRGRQPFEVTRIFAVERSD